jgi:hypothetical protein
LVETEVLADEGEMVLVTGVVVAKGIVSVVLSSASYLL